MRPRPVFGFLVFLPGPIFALWQLSVPAGVGSYPGSELGRIPRALIIVVASAVVLGAFELWRRSTRLNEVYVDDPHLASPDRPPTAPSTTRRISDRELANLTTSSSTPPPGVDAWQARALSTNRVDKPVADAFLAGLLSTDALEYVETRSQKFLQRGANFQHLTDTERSWVEQISDPTNRIPFGRAGYDTTAIRSLESPLYHSLLQSGWWRSGREVMWMKYGAADSPWVWLLIGVLAVLTRWISYPFPLAVGASIVTTALLCVLTVPITTPVRTPDGSAYTIAVRSFQLFLNSPDGAGIADQNKDASTAGWTTGEPERYAPWAVAFDDRQAWATLTANAKHPPPRELTQTFFGPGTLGSKKF